MLGENYHLRIVYIWKLHAYLGIQKYQKSVSHINTEGRILAIWALSSDKSIRGMGINVLLLPPGRYCCIKPGEDGSSQWLLPEEL